MGNSDIINVLLGPKAELHTGIHGALQDHPPAGVRYYVRDHVYHYRFVDASRDTFNPFDHLSISETIRFVYPKRAHVVIHSSRMPVENTVPWLADMDCLLMAMSYGLFFSIGSVDRIEQQQIPRGLVRLRQRLMLLNYLSPWCKALLFRTDYSRRRVLAYLRDAKLLNEDQASRLEEKMDVIYPALPVRGTIQKDATPTVIYMGRTHEDKGGAVALQVFPSLARKYGNDVNLVFVGDVGDAVIRQYPEIRFYPLMSRNAYLSLLDRSHIMFSPTDYESFGFGLLEAANCGLALVTTSGKAMPHIEELFVPKHNAMFVDGGLPFSDRVKEFARCVCNLVDKPQDRRQMSQNNLRLFDDGPFSQSNRDRLLVAYYENMVGKSFDGYSHECAAQKEELLRNLEVKEAIWDEDICLREKRGRTGGRPLRVIVRTPHS